MRLEKIVALLDDLHADAEVKQKFLESFKDDEHLAEMIYEEVLKKHIIYNEEGHNWVGGDVRIDGSAVKGIRVQRPADRHTVLRDNEEFFESYKDILSEDVLDHMAERIGTKHTFRVKSGLRKAEPLFKFWKERQASDDFMKFIVDNKVNKTKVASVLEPISTYIQAKPMLDSYRGVVSDDILREFMRYLNRFDSKSVLRSKIDSLSKDKPIFELYKGVVSDEVLKSFVYLRDSFFNPDKMRNLVPAKPLFESYTGFVSDKILTAIVGKIMEWDTKYEDVPNIVSGFEQAKPLFEQYKEIDEKYSTRTLQNLVSIVTTLAKEDISILPEALRIFEKYKEVEIDDNHSHVIEVLSCPIEHAKSKNHSPYLKILKDRKVHERIFAGVLKYDELCALQQLYSDTVDLFDSEDAWLTIGLKAFQSEKSKEKLWAMMRGMKLIGSIEALKDFYEGKVSDNKYAMIEEFGLMKNLADDEFRDEIAWILEGKDDLKKYGELCDYLEIKNGKPKYVKTLERLEGKEGNNKKRYNSAQDKLKQTLTQLKERAIQKSINGVHVRGLATILGEEHEDEIYSWFTKNKELGEYWNGSFLSDIGNAVNLYSRIYINKDKLKQLLHDVIIDNSPNKQLLEASENVKFIESMQSQGINMMPWLSGYEVVIKLKGSDEFKTTQENLAQEIGYCQRDILLNLRELAGLEPRVREVIDYFDNTSFDSIESVDQAKQELIEYKKQISRIKVEDEKLKGARKTSLDHLGNLIKMPVEYRKSFDSGASLKGKVRVYLERNPIKILQMGNYFNDSCLATSKENSWSTVANAIDANNAVLYAEQNGKIVGRKLLKLNDEGEILQNRSYSNNLNLNMGLLFNICIDKLCEKMNTEVGEAGEASYKNTLAANRWYSDGFKSQKYFFENRQSA